MPVSRARAVSMVVIAVLWAVTPTVACFLPMRTMTAAEHECCKKMAHQCGSMAMPSSHSCCQHPDQRDNAVSPVPTCSPTRHVSASVVSQTDIILIHSASISRHMPALETPPPEPSPACSSVLRI
jgi:hypothetical protein